jgi:hypothetical protein
MSPRWAHRLPLVALGVSLLAAVTLGIFTFGLPGRAPSAAPVVPPEWEADVRAARMRFDPLVRESLAQVLRAVEDSDPASSGPAESAPARNACVRGKSNFKIHETFRVRCQLTLESSLAQDLAGFRERMLRLHSALLADDWLAVDGGIAEIISEYWDARSRGEVPVDPGASYSPNDLPESSYRQLVQLKPSEGNASQFVLRIRWKEGPRDELDESGSPADYKLWISNSVEYFRR